MIHYNIIRPYEKPQPTVDESLDYMTLEKMYEITKSEIVEFIYLEEGFVLIIDEEGKLKNRQINTEATKAYHNANKDNPWALNDNIVGTAICIHKTYLK